MGHEIVAIDGKTLRRSHDERLGKAAVHMISAWAEQNSLVLAQMKVDGKTNEITVIPELLRLLDLHGCIITIDAMGCQSNITKEIRDQGGDYVLPVKENQGLLLRDVRDTFTMAEEAHYRQIQHDTYKVSEKGHGRIEVRHYWTISEPEYIAYINRDGRWPGLRSIGLVKTERRENGTVERQTRYYITSLNGDAGQFASAVRGHWGIENRVHWVLDVAFREDDSRIRQGHSAENLATIRHMALNMLRHETSLNRGIKTRRMKAAWDPSYLLQVLRATYLDA
jgi:predicted transposase YbfD/YdcC